MNKQNYIFHMMEMMCLKEKLTQTGRQKKKCSKGYFKDIKELKKSKRRAKGVSSWHQKASGVKEADEACQMS